jgi:hypothetical protein
MVWAVERVPAPTGQSVLHTAAAGHGTAWAFGVAVVGSLSTLVFRRDERGWQRVDVPDVGRANKAVVLSETELWIVGDGTSLHRIGDDWREVALSPSDRSAQMFGLIAFGESDLWTAGYAPGPDRASGTVQRWDGTSWTGQSLPDVAERWALAGIGGVAPDDLWAVGGVHGRTGAAVALHRDGGAWRSVPVPMPGDGAATLSDVLALASDDVWTTGYRRFRAGRARQPFAAHWDGAEWSLADMPDDEGQIRALTTDGRRVFGIGYGGDQPYVVELHDGTCRIVPGPPPPDGAVRYSLHGGTVLPDGRLLVVGAASDSPTDAEPYVAVLVQDA